MIFLIKGYHTYRKISIGKPREFRRIRMSDREMMPSPQGEGISVLYSQKPILRGKAVK